VLNDPANLFNHVKRYILHSRCKDRASNHIFPHIS
jgi:hypothetical protein